MRNRVPKWVGSPNLEAPSRHLWSGARSFNERGARAHVLSDLPGSGAASAAALVIIFTDWTIADPLLSFLVSGLIFRSGLALTRESADVLLEGAPAGFDVKRVESELIGAGPGRCPSHPCLDHDR